MDDALEVLFRLLRERGTTDQEIEEAAARGPQGLIALAVDRIVVPGRERLTRDEVAQRAGVDQDRALAFWRAMGFVEVEPDQRIFTEVDVELLGRVLALIDGEIVDEELALQMTRVMGHAMSRVAEAQQDFVRRRLEQNREVDATEILTMSAAGGLLEDLERFLVHVWRRHLAAATERIVLEEIIGEDVDRSVVVGFADLVGFTAITTQMEPHELAAAVSRFERVAHEIVAQNAGRVVKTIGDEVMFTAPSTAVGAEIALSLVEAFADDETLPDVRVGVASGHAINHQGDLFGETPNMASRLVDTAYPGSVLVSPSVREVLEDDERFRLKVLPLHRLKGFGRSKVWVLRRAPSHQP